MEPIKNRLIRKTRPQELKTLSFVSSHMSDNFKVIHFHMKIRDWQGLLFVQILYGNCTSSFYFENWYRSGNCQFLALIGMELFRMFTHFYAALFLIKRVFMKLAKFFITGTRCISTKLLGASGSLIKIQVRSHGTFFVILHTSAVICKHIFLWKQNCVHLQSCKGYKVGQDYFRKPL